MFIEMVLFIIIFTVISCVVPQSVRFQAQIIVLGLVMMGRGAYSYNKLRGIITEFGIKRCDKETEILFPQIRNISGNKILKILTIDGLIEKIFLSDLEVVKLTKTQFNNIIISDGFIIITPREDNQEMLLTYSPVGKYRFDLSWEFFVTIGMIIGIFSLLLSEFSIGWAVLIFFMGLALQAFLEKYKQIFIEICNNGITIKMKDDLHFIPFEDVISVEKKLFSIKLETITKTLFLPRRCCFLYALIVEYTNDIRLKVVNSVDEKK